MRKGRQVWSYTSDICHKTELAISKLSLLTSKWKMALVSDSKMQDVVHEIPPILEPYMCSFPALVLRDSIYNCMKNLSIFRG